MTPDDMDLETLLLEHRVVFLRGEINPVTADRVVMQMLYLRSVDAERPMTLVVDSHGGLAEHGFEVVDMVRYLDPLVRTHCGGRAEGMAAVIVAAGARGRRTATPGATFVLGECGVGAVGATAADVVRTNEVVRRVLVKATGRPDALIAERMRERCSMRAAEAVALGLIDGLVEWP
jgi:ATP-dependent Clp protease protease subunit